MLKQAAVRDQVFILSNVFSLYLKHFTADVFF